MLKSIVNTIIPVDFKKFISQKISESKKMFMIKKRMNVDAKPEFIKFLKISNMVASVITPLIIYT